MTTPVEQLERFAARWRWRVRLTAIAVAVSISFTVGVIAYRLLDPTTGIAAGCIVLVTGLWLLRARITGSATTARILARHLDRIDAAFEDSAELLLDSPSALGALEQMQRARVARVLAALDSPRLPQKQLRAALAGAGGVTLLGIGALAARPSAATLSAVHQSTSVTSSPARITNVRVTITAPVYTHHAAREEQSLDVDAESGAVVTWRIALSRPDAVVQLITSEHDTVALAGSSIERTASITATKSLLYSIEIAGVAGGEEFHRLSVIPDRAPTVTIVTPKERTTIEPSDPLVVPVEVLGRDDYGLGTAEIVATITTGAGENVKFREQRLPFTSSVARDSSGRVWRTSLDLVKLGLAPGDELYFHAVAKDNRRPEPNEGQSETAFIIRVDTARVMVSQLTGLTLKLEPEFFRSERQIIIDTEKLLADQPKITLQQFRDRAADIGIDQHLLRVRYGEMVGDENEGGPGHDIDHEGGLAIEKLGPQIMAIPDEYVHKHDVADNATRLATGIKATLKDALAQMWDAERNLRTYEPKRALPYEYKALEMLKQIQQAARVYVKRVGFEPPPIDVAKKRLTGEQKEIVGRTDARSRAGTNDRPAIREAIALLSSSASLTSAAERAILQAAGEAVATQALTQPGRHLELLGTLRSLRQDPANCTACRAKAVSGLLTTLPDPAPAPLARERISPAGRAYLDRLHSGS